MYKLQRETRKNTGLNLVESRELQGISADLGLRLVPRIERYQNIPGHIIQVHTEYFSVWKDFEVQGTDYSSLIVESSKPIYVINVDMGKLFSRQRNLYTRYGVWAAYDYTAVVIMRACRSIWVGQEQLTHGLSTGEVQWATDMEAMQYPVDACVGRRRLIALRELYLDRGMVDTPEFAELEARISRAYRGIR